MTTARLKAMNLRERYTPRAASSSGVGLISMIFTRPAAPSAQAMPLPEAS
jgi:hypothetical protein